MVAIIQSAVCSGNVVALDHVGEVDVGAAGGARLELLLASIQRVNEAGAKSPEPGGDTNAGFRWPAEPVGRPQEVFYVKPKKGKRGPEEVAEPEVLRKRGATGTTPPAEIIVEAV